MRCISSVHADVCNHPNDNGNENYSENNITAQISLQMELYIFIHKMQYK